MKFKIENSKAFKGFTGDESFENTEYIIKKVIFTGGAAKYTVDVWAEGGYPSGKKLEEDKIITVPKEIFEDHIAIALREHLEGEGDTVVVDLLSNPIWHTIGYDQEDEPIPIGSLRVKRVIISHKQMAKLTRKYPELIQHINGEETAHPESPLVHNVGAGTGDVTDYSATIVDTIKVDVLAHGLQTGSVIELQDNVNYNGRYEITVIDTDSFYITCPFIDESSVTVKTVPVPMVRNEVFVILYFETLLPEDEALLGVYGEVQDRA